MTTNYFSIILLNTIITIINIGDIIKYIIEGNYIYKNTINIYELLLYIYHIIIFTLIILLRIIYTQIEFGYFNYFNQRKIIKWLLILCCKEIGIVILLLIYTNIFNEKWMVIGVIWSSIFNSIYLRIYFKEYLTQNTRISPNIPNILLTSIIPSQYIIQEHICKEKCDICPCIICSETIDNFVELKCKHQLHHNCLIKWLNQKKTTCPLCRSEV